jgi:acid phosphatase
MTTLEPRAPYTAEELAKLYPKELELQQVQILLRHGERTPVNARFKNTGLGAFWPYCAVAKAMRSAVIESDGTIDTLKWKRRLESLGNGDAPTLNAGSKGEIDAICQPGELTDRGRETTLALGQRIRKLYVNQLAFLPSNLDSMTASNVTLRSTPIPRALESVQQAYLGLYPFSTRATGLPSPAIVTRSMQDETLFPNEGACKRFAELARAFADRTAKLYNSGPELAYINKKIGKWMPEASPVVAVDSHPRLSGVMDTVNATLAHGPDTKMPKEFYDKKMRGDIDKVCVEEWFVGYQESNEYRKLGVGSMIADLAQRMVEHVRSENTVTPEHFKMSLSGW